jgi:gamma-glutamyltranspeptidase/glutathione hydrolase
VADAIDRFCRTQAVMDVSGEPHRGVLTGADMAAWQPSIEAPLTYDYGRYTVCKAGVWSQGPVMLQQLALLKGFDLDGLDPAGADFIHLQVECANSPLRIARPSTAIRSSSRCRSRSCCRIPTTRNAAS